MILFNLGGPEKLEDVQPFLYNLFSDPDIIRIRSGFLRKLLARVIAVTRARKSRALYRQIGGGSPLRKITECQADALRRRLEVRGTPCRVYVGMRCWKPAIEDATDQMGRDGITHAVALPLFPQFSFTTTGSCFNYFRKVLEKSGLASRIKVTYVDTWYEEPSYIEAIAGLIRDSMALFTEKNHARIHLLYSAHSIPARYVEDEGDPYLEQTRRTVNKVNESLGNICPSTLAFQSKVGPVKWLGPPTDEMLRQMGRSGIKSVLAIPISFVSDHIETLQEIDILYKKLAADCGIVEFRRAESLNLHSRFIEALADITQRTFEG